MYTPGPWKVFWIDAEEDWPNHILIGDEDSEEVVMVDLKIEDDSH